MPGQQRPPATTRTRPSPRSPPPRLRTTTATGITNHPHAPHKHNNNKQQHHAHATARRRNALLLVATTASSIGTIMQQQQHRRLLAPSLQLLLHITYHSFFIASRHFIDYHLNQPPTAPLTQTPITGFFIVIGQPPSPTLHHARSNADRPPAHYPAPSPAWPALLLLPYLLLSAPSTFNTITIVLLAASSGTRTRPPHRRRGTSPTAAAAICCYARRQLQPPHGSPDQPGAPADQPLPPTRLPRRRIPTGNLATLSPTQPARLYLPLAIVISESSSAHPGAVNQYQHHHRHPGTSRRTHRPATDNNNKSKSLLRFNFRHIRIAVHPGACHQAAAPRRRAPLATPAAPESRLLARQPLLPIAQLPAQPTASQTVRLLLLLRARPAAAISPPRAATTPCCQPAHAQRYRRHARPSRFPLCFAASRRAPRRRGAWRRCPAQARAHFRTPGAAQGRFRPPVVSPIALPVPLPPPNPPARTASPSPPDTRHPAPSHHHHHHLPTHQALRPRRSRSAAIFTNCLLASYHTRETAFIRPLACIIAQPLT